MQNSIIKIGFPIIILILGAGEQFRGREKKNLINNSCEVASAGGDKFASLIFLI
jgi:hypothetical protein